jgi:hypothetical protein
MTLTPIDAARRTPVGQATLTSSWTALAITAMLIATAPSAAQASTAACAAESSPTVKARVIELYTSQGCSSCPPADRWLRGIAAQPASHAVVPLSMHVKYWDYIGWKDPYAQEAFTQRQRWLAQVNLNRTVYTPGVFLDGSEWAQWSSSASQQAKLQGATAVPQASITMTVSSGTEPSNPAVSARVTAQALDAPARASQGAASSTPRRLALFIALTESGIGNRVSAGENRGEHLLHDHVVRLWSGPHLLDADGAVQHTLTLPGDVKVTTPSSNTPAGRYALSALVQDLDKGQVMQAMRMDLRACLKR